jgi:LacI family gluconate utilization system Gnt-I transcriptional repressor
VPGRLAIAGCGDIDVAAALVPALTTLRIPRYRLGHVAGEMLLARLQGRAVAQAVVDLGFELVPRQST